MPWQSFQGEQKDFEVILESQQGERVKVKVVPGLCSPCHVKKITMAHNVLCCVSTSPANSEIEYRHFEYCIQL